MAWLGGVDSEIRYWENYIKTNGGDYSEDFAFRLRQDTYVDERDYNLAQKLQNLGRSAIKILDVGSGPLTNLGKKLRSGDLQIFPCDPLADVYNQLLAEAGITPPVATLFTDVENISMYYSADFFDAVHCCNALDHSYNPVGGICEMLRVLKPDGFVQLGHFENEAEHEGYIGLHQWNFSERKGDFVIWNKQREISMRQLLGASATISAQRQPTEINRDWILVEIHKHAGIENILTQRESTLPIKYRSLLARTLIAMRGNGEASSSDEAEIHWQAQVASLAQALERANNQLQRTRDSYSFKLGFLLLEPVRWIKAGVRGMRRS
jgi:SAM-dependent methyltransferase